MNQRLMYTMARTFEHVGNEAFDTWVELGQNRKDLNMEGHRIAAFVNLAFSAEVYLKCLLVNQGNHQRGHKLERLFIKLDEPTRGQVNNIYDSLIKKHYGKNLKKLIATFPEFNESLTHNLKMFDDAFEKWRYIYETPPSTGPGFLMEFVEALRETIVSIHPDFKYVSWSWRLSG